ncbi:MAG TPA: hypothetical protein ENK44_13015 [Caldithrix abyssi]|uniref:PpiC domain-containing protein n=1 Tax=Caldithrix abyssi TaxID=187145 RepID=A0A7V4U2T0_CALAY|nr:hypothetical protein [Caldithrix abyssi]
MYGKQMSCKIICLLVVLIFLVQCKQEKEIPREFVAQVNDQYLLNKHLQYSVPPGLDEETAFALKSTIISRWVEDEVLYQTAVAEGMTLSDKEKHLLHEYEKSLYIQKYLTRKLDRDYRISEKEIEDYYDDHVDEFKRSEDEVHIIHLLMEQRDNAIFKEIRQAKDLNEIIRKYYFDEKSTPEQPNGDLGYVKVSSLDERFVKTIKRLKTGSITKPIKTDQGYHFIQLLDWQKKGTTIDLDLVRDEIILRLKRLKREEERQRLLRELKEKAQIQTYLSKIEQ